MIKYLNIIKKNKTYSILVLLALLVFLYYVLARGHSTLTSYKVIKGEVSQSVILSGRVQTSDRADLGFASSGRIAQVYVKNNESVSQGQVLSQLEIGDLLADLKIKQANLTTSDIDLESAKEELEKITFQEDTKVENAYRNLLSSGLGLTPDKNTYTVSSPVVTGIYDGSPGKYKIIIDKKNITDTDLRLTTFDLERSSVILDKEKATPLGIRGLYISFPMLNVTSYQDTIWYLYIPNKSSDSYLENYNNYTEVKKNRDLAIQSAQFKYKKLLAEKPAKTATPAVDSQESKLYSAWAKKNNFAFKIINKNYKSVHSEILDNWYTVKSCGDQDRPY